MASVANPLAPPVSRCKRPLPPPDSRDVVLSQIKDVQDWTVVDQMEDLQIYMPRKVAKLNHEKHDWTSCTRDQAAVNMGITEDFKYQNTAGSFISASSTPNRKKALFESDAHRCRLRQLSEAENLAATGESGIAGSTAMLGNNDDKEYQHVGSEGAVHSISIDSSLGEACLLAKITHDNCPTPNDTGQPSWYKDFPSDGPKVAEAEIARQHLEQVGHERSRQRREQALARRSKVTAKPGVNIARTWEHGNGRAGNSKVSSIEAECRERSNGFNFKQYDPSSKDAEAVSNSQRAASPDIDELFEVAGHASRDYQTNVPRSLEVSMKSDKSHGFPHPASRIAAEEYRAQSRHLAGSSQVVSSFSNGHTDFEVREARLRAFTSHTFEQAAISRSDSDNHQKHQFEESSLMADPNTQALSITTNTLSASSEPSSPLSPRVTQPANPLNAPEVCVRTTPITENVFTRRSHSPNIAKGSTQSIFAFPPLRPPNPNLVHDSDDHASIRNAVLEFDAAVYPEEPAKLTLPKGFEDFDQDYRNIIRENEILKNRSRDLEVIIPTFEQIARFGTLDQFSDQETNELKTVHEFTRAVVDAGRSGQQMRSRINNIRDNMKRRVQKHPPCDVSYKPLLDTLLKPERHEQIGRLISETQSNCDRLRFLRNAANTKWRKTKDAKWQGGINGSQKRSAKQKRVRFDSSTVKKAADAYTLLPDGAIIDLPDRVSSHDKHLSLTQRKRKARYAAADKKEALLRDRLALFQSSSSDSQYQFNRDAENSLPDERSDVSSVTSEEEEGAEYFTLQSQSHILPTSVPPVVDTREEAAAEVDHQVTIENALHHHHNAQAVHDDLLISMQQRNNRQAILSQQHVQKPSLQLLADNRNLDSRPPGLEPDLELVQNTEFDDLDYESCVHHTSVNGENVTCYRYIVKAQFVGVRDLEENTEHDFGKFLSSEEATLKLDDLRKDMKDAYMRTLTSAMQPVLHEDLWEDGKSKIWLLEFGRDARLSCRAWVEQEEYSPSVEAYSHAKVARACHAQCIYTVLWQRIVTPADNTQTCATEESANDSGQADGHINNDELPLSESGNLDEIDDELFGPDPPYPINESAADNEQFDDSEETINEVEEIHLTEDIVLAKQIEAAENVEGTGTTEPEEKAEHADDMEDFTYPPGCAGSHIKIRALRFFTNIASANRHAKDVFMGWYMDHYRDRRDHHYIEKEEHAIESELESYGDKTMWERKESFDIYTDVDSDDDDTDGEAEGEDAAENRDRRKMVENDCFRVWVVQRNVVGPAN